MKVVVNQKTFKSKKELENYTRDLLFSVRENLHDAFEITNDKLQFIKELFKRHPDYAEKCGSGIDKVFVQGDKLNKKASYVFIKRTDASKTDISWRICVSGKGKTTKAIQNEILRKSIEDQVLRFRKETINVCNSCDIECKEYDVDHYDAEFCDIVKQFLEQYQLPTEFKETDHGHAFRDEDIELEIKWKNFHLEKAKLQKLCKACHKRKTYKW